MRAPSPAGLSTGDISGTTRCGRCQRRRRHTSLPFQKQMPDSGSHRYSLAPGDVIKDVQTSRDGILPAVADKGMARSAGEVRDGKGSNGEVPRIAQG